MIYNEIVEIAVYTQHTYMNIYRSTPELITDVNISFYNNDAGSLHRHRWRKIKNKKENDEEEEVKRKREAQKM